MNDPTPYDSPDYHALIHNMRTDDSDIARLVAADWLEERGESERASFIRLSVESGSIARSLKKRRQSSRWRSSIHEYGGCASESAVTSWIPGARISVFHEGWHSSGSAIITALNFSMIEWSRGFAGLVTGCSFRWWVDYGPDIVRRHPITRIDILSSASELQLVIENISRISAMTRGIGYGDYCRLLKSIADYRGMHQSWDLPPHNDRWRDGFNAACLKWAEDETREEPVKYQPLPRPPMTEPR